MKETPAPLHRCRVFIFDMDGTLTVPQHDFDAIRAMLGIPEGQLILEYLDALPAAERRQKRAQLNKAEAELAAESEPAPGLFELFEALRSHQVAMAVLTRNSLSNARISLNAIGARQYFDERRIIGRDEAIPKPDPAGINLLARQFKTTAQQCAMVGDYRHDLEAGTRAGAHSVHVRHAGTPCWPEFTQTTVKNLHELRKVIPLP